MKLRNKKTGEIGHFTSTNWNEIALIIMDDNGVRLAKYSSLAELNEEWEDYKEPKEKRWYWCVDYITCGVDHLMYDPDDPDQDEFNESIGNYFETEEEAKKAVEKLKAWKRLKDAGFGFKDFARLNDCATMIRATSDETWSEIYDDLNTCFGGEE